MIHRARFALPIALVALATLAACGGSTPPPKTEEAPKEERRPDDDDSGGMAVSQELGSIDPRAVEQSFDKLASKLEGCHTQGRERVEYLAGDVKVFLRIGRDGRVRYGYFEESTLGDRETEKCILDVLFAADWPKPKGGEAEVRNGFGWPSGSERPPTPWGPEKVTSALDADKETKKAVDKCKAGVSGDFHMTAYVEPGEPEGHASSGGGAKGKGGKKGNKASGKKSGDEHGGRFKAIGGSPPSKEGAEKIDCIVDALRGLSLPSPGGYAAKVTFAL